jgi:hypothetical protein
MPNTRTIDCCSLCGSQVEHDAEGPCCDGAEVVQAEIFRPMVVGKPAVLGSQADLERLGLVLPAHLMASVGAA